MPRVRLDPEYWRTYGRDYLRKNTTQKRLATALNKSQPAVCRKLETMNFSLEEFREVIKDTGMSDEAVLRIMK